MTIQSGVPGGPSGLAEPEIGGQVVTESASSWAEGGLVLTIFLKGPQPRGANRDNENSAPRTLTPFQALRKTLSKNPVWSSQKPLCEGIILSTF